MESTQILAIDMGSNHLGIAVINTTAQITQPVLIFSEHFETSKKVSIGKKLTEINQKVKEIIDKYDIRAIAIEGSFFFGKEANGYKYIQKAIGAVEMAAAMKNLEVTAIAPMSVKKSVTGNGHASKEEVAAAVKIIFSLSDNVSDHLSDACAIGLAYLNKSDEPPQEKKKKKRKTAKKEIEKEKTVKTKSKNRKEVA